MKNLTKKLFSIILAVILLCSLAMPCVSALDTTKQPSNVKDVVKDCETITVYFYFPESWQTVKNYNYDAEVGLTSCAPTVYWWEGSYNCEDYYFDSDIPSNYGYTVTEKVTPNIYKMDIPADVNSISFANGYHGEPPLYSDYYWSFEIDLNTLIDDVYFDYRFYENINQSVDGMIYVIDKFMYTTDLSFGYSGCWFYYYGNGQYGYIPELENCYDIYSNGEFPTFKERETVENVRLAKNQYTYNGKKKTPKVIATDKNGVKLTEGTDFTVAYPKGSKKVGNYTATVTFKGKYKGETTLDYKILPSKVKVKDIVIDKKTLTVKWKAQNKQLTGYKIQYSTSPDFKNCTKINVKNAKATQKKIKNIKPKKTHYIRIRSYKIVNGKKLYSDWTTRSAGIGYLL